MGFICISLTSSNSWRLLQVCSSAHFPILSSFLHTLPFPAACSCCCFPFLICGSFYLFCLLCSVVQSCLTFFSPMDCSPPHSSAHGIFQQEHWSGLLFPTPGHLPNLQMETVSLESPALAGGFFTTSATWEALVLVAGYLFWSLFIGWCCGNVCSSLWLIWHSMVIFGCINLYFNSQIFKGFIYDLCIFISSLRRPSLRNSTLLYILKFEICFSHLCLNSSELIFKSATRWKSNFLFFSMDNQTVPHHLQRQHKCSEYINISSVNNDIFISSLAILRNFIPSFSYSSAPRPLILASLLRASVWKSAGFYQTHTEYRVWCTPTHSSPSFHN